MTKKEEKKYWSIKNRIGYALLSGNDELKRELEKELEHYLRKEGKR